MIGWDQITQALDAVAREYGTDAAAELAERLLMRYDDSRIVRILGDYENEPIPNTSIKGMLYRILQELAVLRDIDAKLADNYVELSAINQSTTRLAKYSPLQPTVNDQQIGRYGELRQSYIFRAVRRLEPPRYEPAPINRHKYEFFAPIARIPSPHNGVVDAGDHGCHVRIAQNHQLGLSPYVYTSFIFRWYLNGQQVAPVIWQTASGDANYLDVTLSSQPYIPIYANDPNRPETVQAYDSIGGGFGYIIYRKQLRYDAHDYLWMNVCMIVWHDNDPQVPWFQSGSLQCQLDVYTGYINDLD